MNINSNIISRYDDMLYENRPASLNEFLSNKYNNVHNELYKSALDKFIYSLINKYVTKNFLFEYFELLSEIDADKETDIVFENIYEKIFANKDNSPLINYMLEELSIDRFIFFKTLYNTTVNKLNSVKVKLINFYRDKNYNIKSAIQGISEICDIQDFRLAYIISGIGSETNNERNVFTLCTDDNGDLVVTNKVVFNDSDESDEYINQNMYYYVGTEIPTFNMDILNDDRWNTLINESIIEPIWEWSDDLNEETNNGWYSTYYVAIPAGYGIYRNNIKQLSLSMLSPYTFVKSIIINKIVYNVYITSLTIDKKDNLYDVIKINNESVVNNIVDDFDLICSEDKDYIMLYDFENNVRIGYDEEGKWLLIVNDEHPINTIDILDLENIVKQYMNYESNTLLNLYKNMICNLYKKYHKIIEIKNSEYWMPSYARIINKIPPYTKINIDLTDYWNMNQSNDKSKLSDLKITKENMLDSELIELNYVNGKAKVQSRTNDTIYEVPFKYLDETVNVSDDMILSNSFISKYNDI